ncbi:MAG TPA: hypothetical protein PKW41_12280, partial [Clostridia bacterium]|nr:hypothetical protein [Clostridia bacterium]
MPNFIRHARSPRASLQGVIFAAHAAKMVVLSGAHTRGGGEPLKEIKGPRPLDNSHGLYALCLS